MSDEQSEIEAAAERMERWVECCSSGRYDEHEYHEDSGLQQLDEGLLVDWAVARLTADRAEREEWERSIDEAWLRSVCESQVEGFGLFAFRVAGDFIFGEIAVAKVGDGWMCHGLKVKTRGQLLDLLAALGVERKGGAK